MTKFRIRSLDEVRPKPCRSCGQRILWARTLAGKAMPVEPDAAVHYRGAPQETEDGTPFWEIPSQKAHFANCPNYQRRQKSADNKEARFRGERDD